VPASPVLEQVLPPAAALSILPLSFAASAPGVPVLAGVLVLAVLALAASAVWGWLGRRRAAGAESRLREAERQLREAERRHRALVEDNGVGMWQVTPTGETLYVNAAMCELLEVETPAEVAGKSYDLFFTPESVAAIRRERALRDRGDVSSYEVDLVGRRGGRRHLMMSGAPVFGEDGRLQSVIGTCLDITSRRQAEDALHESEARLRLVIDQVPAVLWSTDRELRFTMLLGAGLKSLDLAAEQAIGQHLSTYFQTVDPDFPVLAAHRQALQGASVSFEQTWGTGVFRSSIEPLRDASGAIVGCLGFGLDIAEQKRYEAQLGHLADHDALTDLLNRRRFERELRLALTRSRQQRASGALLWCDVDHFKHINDSLGHRTGDELLVKVAASLRENVRRDDVLARLGGDEFAALLPHADADEASQLAQRLLEAVQSITVKVGGKAVRTTVSIGIVLFPEHGGGVEELLSRADLAMYEAKRDGRNRCRLFDGGHEWQERLSSEVARAERLREALEGGGFELYLQPVVDLRPARQADAARFEVLLRMSGPGGAPLAPAEFLGTAARFGMMREIDRWVLGAAIRLIADEAAGGREIHLDVNLSGDAFADPGLLPWIEAAIAAAAVPARCLALEITETAAVTDLGQARRFIEALRRLGCELAIDDFGVGFSSFYYLKHLPIDLLKIDGSFIHDLARNPVSQHLVRAIVGMARGLGIRSVAEYVEDEETLAWARSHGVDYAQGFHVGGPLPARDVLPSQRRGAAAGGGPSRPAPPPLSALPLDR
jgi:diguanylate cyclase (GGDEF)-like protein/PAS domain S-box-containing protein